MTSMCFVVDRHTLAAVHLLHRVDQVDLHLARAEDAQHLLRVDRPRDQLLADLDVTAVLHQEARTLGHRVGDLLRPVVRFDEDLPRAVGVLDPHPAGGLGDRGHTLRGASLEELDDTGQTVGDVVTATPRCGRYASSAEVHGSRSMGGDDADRLADVDELARGQRRRSTGAGADLPRR
jgi:hypothetical protein